jgi:hypothetical protein
MFRTLLILCLFANVATAASTIIESSNRINWANGSTVGLRLGIQTRTNEIDVTLAPYNCPTNGEGDASLPILAAIAAAVSNDVVKLPAGRYNINSNTIAITKNHITIRGVGTNTFLFRTNSADNAFIFNIGQDAINPTVMLIASNVLVGSTNAVLFSTNDLRIGDQIRITTKNRTDFNSESPVFSAFYFDRMLSQNVRIDSFSGTNISFWPPLGFSATNAPAIEQVTLGAFGVRTREGIGIESMMLALTNHNGKAGGGSRIMAAQSLNEFWITDCVFEWANNYHLALNDSVSVLLRGNRFSYALSTGTSHSGLLVGNISGVLTENNIFSHGLQPAIEWNSGVIGNAFFGNFLTNNLLDMVSHNAHPMMNLFEANVFDNYMEDGYFGSTSHNTTFRNHINSGYQPLRLKRWVTFHQAVGNVLGRGDYTFAGGLDGEFPTGDGSVIVQIGLPNIGNNSYVYTNPPTPWNFPGFYNHPFSGNSITNGAFTFTGNYGPTNVLWTNMGVGTFTNIIEYINGVCALIFQDGSNTNFYYAATNGGSLTYSGSGTESNLTLASYVYITNGSKLFFSSQQAYQTVMRTNRHTHNITGNFVYTNAAGTLVWSANNTNRVIPASLLYPGGPPSWWGTNRWPAIDPESAQVVAIVPAMARYFGIDGGGEPPPAEGGPWAASVSGPGLMRGNR